MSVEILRRAAALMRERAEAVQAWKRRYPEDSGGEYAMLTASFLENAIANHAPGSTSDLHLRTAWEYDGEHLASWHPAVALAVADWLDTAGADIWAHGPMCECGTGCDACDDNLWEPHARDALSVARTYLGEDA